MIIYMSRDDFMRTPVGSKIEVVDFSAAKTRSEIPASTTHHILADPRLRPTRNEIFQRMAHLIAERSPCIRLHVGCIITDEALDNVLGIGYNGPCHGAPNICDRTEPGNCGCVCAEANALTKADWRPRRRAFVTHLPCFRCAKLLVNAGIISVHVEHDYTYQETKEIFQKAGVELIIGGLNV